MADRVASAVWEGELFTGKGTVTLESSGLATALPVSWPARTEESNGQTSPEELIAAAHAACFSMALSNQLVQRGQAAERLEVSATVTFAKGESGFSITTSALQVRGVVPGMTAETFAEATQAAKTGCPVSRALAGNVEITLDATLA